MLSSTDLKYFQTPSDCRILDFVVAFFYKTVQIRLILEFANLVCV